VSAKDKATNKDAAVTIAAGSGLSDEEVERMMADAEQHAEADKARKALIEESNCAQSVAGETSKAIAEFGEQLAGEEKENVLKLVKELEELAAQAQGGESEVDADTLRQKIDATQQASLGLFKKVYEARAQANDQQQQPKEGEGEKKD